MLFLTQSLLAQHSNQYPGNGEPGVCYAKCLMNSNKEIEKHEQAYPIYIGDRPDTVELKTVYVVLYEGEKNSQWVKKRADRNCLSADPNDCMVWCLVETKPQPVRFQIQILSDTTQTDDFTYEYFLSKKTIPLKPDTEWKEVICKADLTPAFIFELQEKLSEEGYYQGNPTSIYTSELKLALLNFQKDFDLPYGQIDLETLSELSIYP